MEATRPLPPPGSVPTLSFGYSVVASSISGFGAPAALSYLGRFISYIPMGVINTAVATQSTTTFALAAAPLFLAVQAHNIACNWLNVNSFFRDKPELSGAVAYVVDAIVVATTATAIGYMSSITFSAAISLSFGGAISLIFAQAVANILAPDQSPSSDAKAEFEALKRAIEEIKERINAIEKKLAPPSGEIIKKIEVVEKKTSDALKGELAAIKSLTERLEALSTRIPVPT